MWTEKNNIGSMNPMSNPNLRHANPVAPKAAIQYTTSIHINTFHTNRTTDRRAFPQQNRLERRAEVLRPVEKFAIILLSNVRCGTFDGRKR